MPGNKIFSTIVIKLISIIAFCCQLYFIVKLTWFSSLSFVILFLQLLLETIVNEHPVTIYPGRSSPSRRVPPRTLPGSIERHREVCRQNYDHSSSNEKSSESSSSHTSPEKQPFYMHQITNKSSTSLHSAPLLHHPKAKFDSNDIHLITFDQYPTSKTSKSKSFDNDEDRFSEDSLEESSLPPPPPPPVIPPPPSLSAPVTPSKRHSIAWEINLDDSVSLGEPHQVASNKVRLKNFLNDNWVMKL